MYVEYFFFTEKRVNKNSAFVSLWYPYKVRRTRSFTFAQKRSSIGDDDDC